MEKIKNNFLKIVISIFFILYLWITLNGIYKETGILYEFNRGIVIIGTMIYLALILGIYKIVVPFMQKHKWIKYILLAIILFLCIASACYFRLDIKWENSEEYTWDMGNVFAASEELARTGKIEDTYLLQFPNNIMQTFIQAIVLKIGLIFQCQDLLLWITIFNALVVFFTILLTYLVAKEIYDEKRANLFLIIAFFTTPFYLYTAIFYTDTMSMLFTIWMCYLLVKIKKEENWKKDTILQVILGLVLVIGMKTKLTTSFIIIAAIIYMLLTWDIKKIFQKVRGVVPSFLVGFILMNLIIGQVIYKDKDDNSFKVPKLHWIMIGLNEDGNFTSEDYYITMDQPTYEDKKKAEIEAIKQKLAGYNVGTFLKHLNTKLTFAWGDGTYYGPIKLERQPHHKKLLHEFVLRYGKYNQYYKYIPQAMHFGMLIFILINAYSILKEKNFKNNINIIFIITMCGINVFLLIWENRSRYVLTILPIMLLLEVDGINYINNKINEWKGKKNEKNISNHTNVL